MTNPTQRQFRLSVYSAIWVCVVCICVCCIQLPAQTFHYETPRQRLQFAENFVTQLHLQQHCDHELQHYVQETFNNLEHYFSSKNVSNHCHHIAKMFHPDKFMNVQNHQQVYSDVDRQILSQTYIRLFEHCKSRGKKNSDKPKVEPETTIFSQEPFSFASTYYTYKNQSLQTQTSEFQPNDVFTQHDKVIYLNYVGSDSTFEGVVSSLKCERKCSTKYQPQWICKDETLPDFLTLSVVNVNCSVGDNDIVVQCKIDYNIKYTYFIDRMLLSNDGVAIIWTICVVICVWFVLIST